MGHTWFLWKHSICPFIVDWLNKSWNNYNGVITTSPLNRMKQISMNWHGVISRICCLLNKARNKTVYTHKVYNLLYKIEGEIRLHTYTHTHTLIFAKRNKNDRSETNENSNLWGGGVMGWRGLRWEDDFSALHLLYIVLIFETCKCLNYLKIKLNQKDFKANIKM